MTKVCKFCREEKDLELFEKDKRAPDGHSCRCLVCAKEIKRVSALKHRDERLERQRKYREEHPEEYKAMKHEEYVKHRNTYREYGKKYYEENKEWFIQMSNACRNRRYKKDPTKKLNDDYRHMISRALQGKSSKSSAEKLLGCSIEFYRDYLEGQFTEGMNWDNYGFYGWHMDHYRPCSLFDLTCMDDVLICFNYRNTHPMWAKDNLQKGCSWNAELEAEWVSSISIPIQKALGML